MGKPSRDEKSPRFDRRDQTAREQELLLEVEGLRRNLQAVMRHQPPVEVIYRNPVSEEWLRHECLKRAVEYIASGYGNSPLHVGAVAVAKEFYAFVVDTKELPGTMDPCEVENVVPEPAGAQG
jgi:hypothetical protein